MPKVSVRKDGVGKGNGTKKLRAVLFNIDKHLVAVESFARMGLTNLDIAREFGTDARTFRRWMEEYPQIRDALNSGKALANATVEGALYKRAIGFDYEERKTKANNQGFTSVEVVTKHVPPDVAAITLWLTNQQSDRWKNRTALEHTGPDDGPLQILNFADLARKAEIIPDESVIAGEITDQSSSPSLDAIETEYSDDESEEASDETPSTSSRSSRYFT